MSSALLLLNVIALAAVVAFHYQADGSVDQPASAHYTHHQAPKPAAMSDHALESARNARDIQVEQPSSQPSWIF